MRELICLAALLMTKYNDVWQPAPTGIHGLAARISRCTEGSSWAAISSAIKARVRGSNAAAIRASSPGQLSRFSPNHRVNVKTRQLFIIRAATHRVRHFRGAKRVKCAFRVPEAIQLNRTINPSRFGKGRPVRGDPPLAAGLPARQARVPAWFYHSRSVPKFPTAHPPAIQKRNFATKRAIILLNGEL